MSDGSMISKRVKQEEDKNDLVEQEEALVALVEHRAKEVELLRQRVSYYKSQLVEAEERFQDSQSKLARLRGRRFLASSNASLLATKRVRVEQRIVSPEHINIGSENLLLPKTELIIPNVSPKISQPIKPEGLVAKTIIDLEETAASNRAVRKRAKKSNTSSTTDVEVVEIKDGGTERKFEKKKHKDLIPLVESSSSPTLIRSYSSNLIPSQHKRKLRSLAVCPVNDQLFVTSALDGLVNLWQIQGRG
ncbi:protein tipD-like [Gossypium australe]|uniref:Protein tipD-like n=1 Tax=Gossypium australe TaxID=47621 RepID=A0A5B6ULV8_9ROSI|nr:protein tipD-like [Gossypium australe]